MIDWVAARLDYIIHHELTYRDIAEKYHAAHATVWNRAAQEGWTVGQSNARLLVRNC